MLFGKSYGDVLLLCGFVVVRFSSITRAMCRACKDKNGVLKKNVLISNNKKENNVR